MTRQGDWIQTASGRQFWPLDPHHDEVCIEDIAHALAHQCRYAGHCKTHYSVAQHSVIVSQHCGPDALWGLMHDAAEAYVIDLPRPVKKCLRGSDAESVYDQCERRVMEVICERFGLSLEQPKSVDAADVLLLATEARDLMAPLHPEWHHQEKNGYAVLPDRIQPWNAGKARWEFLRRFQELKGRERR